MKTTKFFIVLFIALISNGIHSQEVAIKKESLPINHKNNCYLRYYYFPNIEAYFDNLKMVYYFKDKGEWTSAAELPENYGGYSLYNKSKVAITNFDEEEPQQFLKIHKKLYPYNSKGRFTNTTASSD